jgi:hypothetical protein
MPRRNSFDEGDDQIMPLGGNFAQTEDISNNNTNHHNNRQNQHIKIPTELPARDNAKASGPMSRSKSVKAALGRAMSTREKVPHVEHTIPNTGFAPSRSKSLRAPPPPRLRAPRAVTTTQKTPDGKENVVMVDAYVPDFPSPGRAPSGQRIFDPQTVAEDEGVVVEKEAGWALDGRQQKKLDDERAKMEEQERLNAFSGEDGDIKHNKAGRQRSKSIKDFFTRKASKSG